MRHLLLAPLLLVLLTGCQSKRDLCAEFISEYDWRNQETVHWPWEMAEKLGIKYQDGWDNFVMQARIESYCEFYKK